MRMEPLLFADENAQEWAFSKRKGVKWHACHFDYQGYDRRSCQSHAISFAKGVPITPLDILHEVMTPTSCEAIVLL